jgi:hypothetical protein
MYANDGDPRCPAGIDQNHLIVQQTNRGMKNALVMLAHASVNQKPWAPVSLNLDRCRMEPRVRWMPVGTMLLLDNSGVADHHIRAWRGDSSAIHSPLEAGAMGLRRPLVNAGFYKINCDRHLWERAWTYVSDHPYVALTDEKGEFKISEVPPGSYALRAWHEGWVVKGHDKAGRQEFQPMEEIIRVRVKSGQNTDVLFEHLTATF